MNRHKLGAALSLVLLAAFGQSAANARLTYHETIGIGGSELITLRGSNMLEIHERVGILHSRLNWILADPTLTEEDIRVRKTADGMAIFAKDRLLVTVMAQDAEYNQTTPEKQADEWCEHFARTLPSLRSAGRITAL